ncbi:unnamed protein product [Arabidopsis lyrata]|nr:unnamed protein product [Arabidopsis lyrata]
MEACLEGFSAALSFGFQLCWWLLDYRSLCCLGPSVFFPSPRLQGMATV